MPGFVKSGPALYWRPPKADIVSGYRIKNYRLRGTKEEMGAKCRELTRELLRWRDGSPKVEAGTWSWIIGRYKSDEFSPIHALKANSRASYLEALDKWAVAIGKLRISSIDFETLMLLKTAMEKKGRSVSYIHRMFTHLRISEAFDAWHATGLNYHAAITDEESREELGREMRCIEVVAIHLSAETADDVWRLQLRPHECRARGQGLSGHAGVLAVRYSRSRKRQSLDAADRAAEDVPKLVRLTALGSLIY
ncbi:hypothetical protein [Pseudogemmobacter bohemicus]|uniref:hypothetical protein n=1 Tax=Pseudogemmobacter bohemicus TaxID=2250708 RepID=UPI000DD357FB|nr:hypothetical protein [Pseudogemmobacter bohemicus]